MSRVTPFDTWVPRAMTDSNSLGLTSDLMEKAKKLAQRWASAHKRPASTAVRELMAASLIQKAPAVSADARDSDPSEFLCVVVRLDAESTDWVPACVTHADVLRLYRAVQTTASGPGPVPVFWPASAPFPPQLPPQKAAPAAHVVPIDLADNASRLLWVAMTAFARPCETDYGTCSADKALAHLQQLSPHTSGRGTVPLQQAKMSRLLSVYADGYPEHLLGKTMTPPEGDVWLEALVGADKHRVAKAPVLQGASPAGTRTRNPELEHACACSHLPCLWRF